MFDTGGSGKFTPYFKVNRVYAARMGVIFELTSLFLLGTTMSYLKAPNTSVTDTSADIDKLKKK